MVCAVLVSVGAEALCMRIPRLAGHFRRNRAFRIGRQHLAVKEAVADAMAFRNQSLPCMTDVSFSLPPASWHLQ